MARIDELIQRLCPDGVEYKPLLCALSQAITDGPHETPKLQENGIPLLSVEAIHDGIIDISKARGFISAEYSELCRKKYKPVVDDIYMTKAATIGRVAMVEDSTEFDIWSPLAAIRPNREIVIPRFLYYTLQSNRVQKRAKMSASKGSQPNLSMRKLEKIEIPIPPLEVQREIVRFLDAFTELEANLQRELDARKRQYEHYRDELLSFGDDVERVPLGDIGQFSMCKRVMKNQTSSEGEVPFYKIGTFGGEPDAYISRSLFEEYRAKYPYPKKGDLLMSCSGTLGRIVEFDGEDAYFQDSNIAWIANDETRVSNRFLKHWYSTNPWPAAKGGTIGRLYGVDAKKMAAPVPLPEVQQDIAAKLDAMVALQENLRRQIKLTHRQYEQYRDQLLDLPKKVV